MAPANPNKVYVNFKENLQFEHGLGEGDSLDEIIIQQRMLYGMAEGSWCLVKLPKYFQPTSESTLVSSKGNLTEVTMWTIKGSSSPSISSPFPDDRLYLTYHGGEDVWPWHTNDFVLTDVQAPHGQQQNWDILRSNPESSGFRGYMACGNDGDEGESGETWDPLLIVPVKEGFETGSVDPDTINEKEIEDFTFNFRLDSKYPVGPYCSVKIDINTGNF